jgi:hypothetical protein
MYCLNPVRVDLSVGAGLAKVTLTFDEWKAVRPAVVEVPVSRPKK